MRPEKLLCLLLLLLTSCGRESLMEVESNDPLVQQDGKYVRFSKERFTGILLTRWPNGSVHVRETYHDGLSEGMRQGFYEDGTLESNRHFRHGEKHGTHEGWWPNGQKRFRYQFSNGAYHGEQLEWYASGLPMHKYQYNHGQEVSARGWRENGQTYLNFVVKGGRKYGLTNARLCFSLQDEQAQYKPINP